MTYDDDLFDDNEVSVGDYSVDQSLENEEEIFTHSPEFKELIEVIRKQLSNVDNFSFILYSKIYQSILDHINWRYRLLSDSTAVHFIVVRDIYNKVNNDKSYDQIQKFKELERSIIVSGYFTEIIAHCIAQLKDNPAVSLHDSFVKYTYEQMLREHAMSTFYLGNVIDKYISYCNANNLIIDTLLIESQIPSQISSLERQVYGQFIHSAEIEYVGVFPDAVDLKDEYNSTSSKFLVEFIFDVQRIIEKIKNGDTSDITKDFYVES